MKDKAKSTNINFSLKVLFYYLILILSVLGALKTEGTWRICFQFLIAFVIVHGVELLHQAIHMLGFTNKRLNHIVGFLLGAPFLVSFSGYQESHFRHHRLVGTPDDSEFFNYGDKSNFTLYTALYLLFMPSHWLAFIEKFSKSMLGWDIKLRNEKRSRSMRIEYFLMGILVSSALVFTYLTGNTILVDLWLLPIIVFGAPLHALVEFPEHFGCNTESKNVYQNTRTIRSGKFMNWYTNGNNFHVEHHRMPGMEIENLGKLHEEIKDNIVYYEKSYISFYGGLLKKLKITKPVNDFA